MRFIFSMGLLFITITTGLMAGVIFVAQGFDPLMQRCAIVAVLSGISSYWIYEE
jgi:hypothetical protein